MLVIQWVQIFVYLICYAASFYALSGVRFELFTNVRNPRKVQLLLLLLSAALAYLSAQFIFAFTIHKW